MVIESASIVVVVLVHCEIPCNSSSVEG